MQNEKPRQSVPLLLGIVIICGGAFLRVNEALVNDVWYDEAFTGMTIRQSWFDIVLTVIHDKVHPPLYYATVKMVTWATGSTDPFHLRLVSLFFGIASIPLSYWLIQQLNLANEDKKWLGLSTMTVLSFSPFFISYSTEARSYSLLLFLMLLAFIFFFKAARKSFTLSKDMVILGVMLLMVMMTHFLSSLILSGFFVAFWLLRMEANKTLYDTHTMTKIGIATLLGWLAVAWVWSATQMGQWSKQINLAWIQPSNLSNIQKIITDFLFGIDTRQNGFPISNGFSISLDMGDIGFVILIASVIAFVIVLQHSINHQEKLRDLIILSAVWIVPLTIDLLISSFGMRIYVDRYVIGYGTMLLIWLLYIWWRVAGKKIVWMVIVYLALLLFIIQPPALKIYSEVIALIPSASPVTIESPLYYLIFKYYLPERDIKLLKQTSGKTYYTWSHTPASIQILPEDVTHGSLVVIDKSADRTIPSTWHQQFETSAFRIYRNQ